MKRAIFTFSAIFILTGFISAQAYEGTIEFKKKKNSAFVIEYPFPPEAVENAIDLKMTKLGIKGKEEKGLFNGDKGFTTYKNALITEAYDGAMDYVIKVERKSKKEDDKSVVYIIMMKDDVNQAGVMDADANSKVKSFLNSFSPDIEAAHLELKIKAQEDLVAKAEKKCKNLLDDQVDMEAKIKKLKDSIEENAKSQELTAKNIEDEKLALEALKATRKQ
ncbi:MAG: hypothetical protein ABUT20_05810 [Bacteroidota bacterium]